MPWDQIRLNIATGAWVIYAPSRRKRPHDFHQTSSAIPPKITVAHSPNCPFCEGNESELESIVLEVLDSTDKTWKIRVIPNKFPAVTPQNSPQRLVDGPHLSLPSYGRHEVVIESPHHSQPLATMSVADIEQIIEVYQQRYLKLMEDPQIMAVMIFRNQGQRAGASLYHPHSQIIATAVVSQYRRMLEMEAQQYFDRWGRCLYCEILQFEQAQQQRVIAENPTYIAFIPYAAEVPYEVWIMPKTHQADFGSLSAPQRREFASILQIILGKFQQKLNDPDYNYIIHTAVRYKAQEPQLHWYCQILPRLTTRAGFEIGTGMNINPSLPEIDAEFLR